MARMSAREIDQAFAEDLTEQQMEMEQETSWDLRFEEPHHDEVIEEHDERSMDWAYEDMHYFEYF